MKILLGGIPLGCDNIGDEAILACVVRMLHEALPQAQLTVATADPRTAEKLGVKTVPPYGFVHVPLDRPGLRDEVTALMRGQDAYLWCGATGLSDYPQVGLELLELAQAAGVPSYIWGVGMDDELNPVFFRARGRRKALLGCLGLTGWYERRLRERLKARIRQVLPKCRGVWLRDPQSVEMLATMGFPGAGVTADSAILMRPATAGQAGLAPVPGSPKRLGLCISTQRQVADLPGVAGMIAAVRQSGAQVLGIPMNPKTDRGLLERLGVECIPGDTPEAVLAAAVSCDAVLSSRLHLLILAANAGTPILGIARGAKLQNWLANFGRTVEGSVYDCDWSAVTRHVLEQLHHRGDWDAQRAEAYARLQDRFDRAREELVRRLAP